MREKQTASRIETKIQVRLRRTVVEKNKLESTNRIAMQTAGKRKELIQNRIEEIEITVTGGTNQDGIRIRVACLSKYALASRSME